jgi:hypothetical protein
MYLIRRHRHAVFRQAALAQLTQDQREQLTRFTNKATGWFTAAIGGRPPGGRADLAGDRPPSLACLAVLVPDHRHAWRVGTEHGASDDPR